MDTRLVAIELGAIDPLLLTLTQSPDVEIQMEALACLCNLSLSGCIGDNSLSCLDAVDVQHLVSSCIAFLCSADATYRLFGAVALGSVVASVGLLDPVLAGGRSLTPLAAVADSAGRRRDTALHRLCTLQSGDRSSREKGGRGGGCLPVLIRSARHARRALTTSLPPCPLSVA